MLSGLGLDLGLGLGGSGAGNLFKSGSDDWPVCAGHAHTLLMDSFFTCQIGLRGARGGSSHPAFGGILAAPPAVSRGLVAAVTAGREAPLRPTLTENQTLA